MKWVKWTQWTKDGCTGFGQMPLKDVQKNLQEFEKVARNLMEKSGADHILYGVKLYDENGEISEVKFYLEPMNDERFEKDVSSLKGATVYVLHRR